MVDRPDFNPVYEEQEAGIRERMLDRISNDWRKNPGDFVFDTVAPAPLEIKQLQISQDHILKNAFAQYAEGQYLDNLLNDIGLTRKKATPNQRTLNITADAGVVIPAGQVLNTVILDDEGDPLEYTVDEMVEFAEKETKAVKVTCNTAGTIGNIAAGSEFIFQPSIGGVKSIVDQGIDILGTDRETDQQAWDRYYFKVSNPDTGGNKNDYKRWTDEVTGVGKIKVIPRWNGNGTVKVVVTDTEGQPATSILVEEVQEYLDPGSQGLGEGKAPCGAKVTAISAIELSINITATVVYESGADQAEVKENFKERVEEYLFEIIFTDQTVSYNKIGAYLVITEGIANYSDLKLNGGITDIDVGSEEVAVLGTVNI